MTSQVEHDQNTHHAPISPEDEDVVVKIGNRLQ